MHCLYIHVHNPYLKASRRKLLNSLKLSFCQLEVYIKLICANVQCVYIVEGQYQIVPAKDVVKDDQPMTALPTCKYKIH